MVEENKPENSKHNDQVATVTFENFFILYDDEVEATFGTVKVGNNGLAKVIGIGNVCLEMDNGSCLLLRDVKHIPNIHLNLVSTSRLDDEGYCNTFSDAQWKLTRGAIAMAQGKKLYNSVEKKLVRSRDVVFMEDQTVQDVEKVDKVVPQYSDGLIDLEPTPLTDLSTNVEHNVQDDQQDLDVADTPMQVETNYQTIDQLPKLEIPLKRSDKKGMEACE
ncbi:hypothetical protein Patl1_10830 [Pistacia atlantica]|uniref:Uncharacterized protein n=1 Tax=Pistacia atlantica TaxID=434234 RepID=A0ACC1A205_9ROSI|nr:hypothetical protein Patl1_10830 [Pistacia atlantica]